jgi:HPt (histidine-containing phosphotransfer) domain-containing protein
VQAQDADAIRQAAHSLKSSSANLGAVQLADLCKTLELCSREKKLSDTATFLNQIEIQYDQVQEALIVELGATVSSS